MTIEASSAPLSRRAVLALAGPLVIANAATPLVGLVDTFVISATGDAAALGGVGIGAVAFAFAYFGFYFLRMSTTGLVAQAAGAGNEAEAQKALARALVIGAGAGLLVGVVVWAFAGPFTGLFQASREAEDAGAAYLAARAIGAPAALTGFALQGWLIGLGRSRDVVAIQLMMCAVNAVLDLLFVLRFDMGPMGVGLGTGLAEWAATAAAAARVWRGITRRGGLAPGVLDRAALLDRAAVRRLLGVNRDLMIRSLGLLVGFAWFTNAGARQGDAALAGNEVLKQFVMIWAFVLDAFAFVAEAQVGGAVGRKSLAGVRRAARITSELAFAFAAVFALATLAGGHAVIDAVVRDAAARDAANAFLPYCAVVPIVGAAAWQADGIFIGATRGAALRKAAWASLALYLATDLVVSPRLGNHGVWLAFLCYYVYRAGALAVAYPALERAVQSGASAPTASATDANPSA